MTSFPIRITRYFSADPFPGIVESELRDIDGEVHRVRDKTSIFSCDPLTKESSYPQMALIEVRVIESDNLTSRALIDIDVPLGLESVEGLTRFWVDSRLVEFT